MTDLADVHALFIANGISEGASHLPAVSGGDVIIIKIARRWKALGMDVHFLSTSPGIRLCRELGLDATFHELPGSPSPSGASLGLRAVKAFLSLETLVGGLQPDIVLTSCEHLYDVLPAYKMKRSRPKNLKWGSILHFVAAPPADRRKAGMVNSLLHYVNQHYGGVVARRGSDAAFAVSRQTAKDYVSKMGFPPQKIHAIPGGIDLEAARRAAKDPGPKLYDGLFMKRLHPMKGVYDLVGIWKGVVEALPRARLAVVGEGWPEVVQNLRRMVAEAHLEDNIEILGPAYGTDAKYALLAKSKILVLPSYEENWAIVVGEALGCGVPVVAYGLRELRQVWGPYVHFVPVGDTRAFVEELKVRLAREDPGERATLEAAAAHISRFDWDTIADGILSFLAPSSSGWAPGDSGMEPLLPDFFPTPALPVRGPHQEG